MRRRCGRPSSRFSSCVPFTSASVYFLPILLYSALSQCSDSISLNGGEGASRRPIWDFSPRCSPLLHELFD